MADTAGMGGSTCCIGCNLAMLRVQRVHSRHYVQLHCMSASNVSSCATCMHCLNAAGPFLLPDTQCSDSKLSTVPHCMCMLC
jgi:hypothetical protein